MLTADEAVRYQAFLESEDYVEHEGPVLRPKWRITPQLLVRRFVAMFQGGSKSRLSRRDISAPARFSDAPPPPVSLEEAVERDLIRYRNLSTTRRPGDFIRRWAMVATTIAAFTLVFGREQPSVTMGMVAGLCALHEFGHWLAMRLLRFRGLFPVFIPFSGDIDRARKLHAPAWQHLVALLAGPLPGMLFAVAVFAAVLLQHQVAPWLLDLAGLAFVLNGIHLLPFLPLDGGKIADLLFFRDLPWLRPLFTISSGVAALAGGVALKSRLMRQVAFTLFGGLIWDLRTISVVRGARKIAWAGELTDENEVLRRAFRSVREEGNSGFVGSYGWHHKIDAMLGEVLRRRPTFITRFFGGGFYLTACLAPVLAITAVLLLPMVPRGFQTDQIDVAREFRESFPTEQDAAINPSAVSELSHLTAVTLSGKDATAPDASTEMTRKSAARRLLPVLAQPLDKIDWADAGVMRRRAELDSATLSVWFDVLTMQMESACLSDRDDEAVRRAEVILHAASKMEPVPTLFDRERLQDFEQSALTVIEHESALGKVDSKRLRGIRDRINLLNKDAVPEVDNYLLVESAAERKRTEEQLKMESRRPLNVCFWRDIPNRTREMIAIVNAPSSPLTSAPVAIARLWKQTRRVGELPPTMEGKLSVTTGEASLIYGFCERQRELTWRRITALSAIGLECSRRQNGKFPQMVRYSVPGGASLELVREGGPWLRLIDLRDPTDRQPPAWLIPDDGPDLAPSKALDHQCPLFGAPQTLDISMQ
jgi:Zn-dependent protease